MADKASNWVPLTNEKLFFAQTLLGYLQQEKDSASAFSANRVAALEESTVVHLYNAYQALLCELAAEHNLPFQAESISLQILNEGLQKRNDGRREIAELMALSDNANSWLPLLFNNYRQRFISKQVKSIYQGEQPADSADLISAINIDACQAPVSFDLFHIYEQLKTLVNAIRAYRMED